MDLYIIALKKDSKAILAVDENSLTIYLVEKDLVCNASKEEHARLWCSA
jgi:hypothetical protein